MDRDLAGRHAAVDRRRGLVAQQLLDRVGQERWVGGQLGTLLGVLGEDHCGVAQETADRLRAGVEQQAAEAGDLLVGEPTGRAVAIVDLGQAQRADHVVLWLSGAAGDQRLEVVPQLELGGHGDMVDHPDARLDVEDLVDVLALLLALVVRHAEQRGDDQGRQVGAEVGDVVESGRADVRDRGGRAQNPRIRSSRPPIRRGVNARETSERRTVCSGGSMKIIDCDARGGAVHHLEHGPPTRDERGRVLRGGLDVGEPGEGPEVVLVVAVDGLLVSHPPPDLVGRCVDDRVERVPVQLAHGVIMPPPSVSQRAAGGGPCPPRCAGARRPSDRRPAPCRRRGAGGREHRARSSGTGRPTRNATGTSPRRSCGPATTATSRHGRREAQHLLDRVREDLVAAAVDEVAGPALDPHEALVVDAGEVAGVDEAVGVDALLDAARRVRRPNEQVPVVVDAQVDAGMGAADGPDLLRVGLGVGRRPADHLADLGLAVAVEHEDRELRREAPGLQGRQRRGDRADVLQRGRGR